jgi:hypothetical protein
MLSSPDHAQNNRQTFYHSPLIFAALMIGHHFFAAWVEERFLRAVASSLLPIDQS